MTVLYPKKKKGGFWVGCFFFVFLFLFSLWVLVKTKTNKQKNNEQVKRSSFNNLSKSKLLWSSHCGSVG